MGSPKARAGNRQSRREAKRGSHEPLIRAVQEESSRRIVKAARTILRPLTENQAEYEKSILANVVTFGTGSAGTGKTYFAAMLAAEALKDDKIEKLIITRPMIEAGESMGFLPGTADEKFEPYLRPVRDALEESLGSGHLEYLLKAGVIEARPLALLRGASFKDSWIIFDEAQNSTKVQMQMFLTRIGQRCKVIVNGDMKQKDIQGTSGLADAVRRFGDLPQFGHVSFTADDIVRSGVCRTIVMGYDED